MADNKFKLVIVSQDGKKIEDEVELVNLVLTDGAIGIMKGHLPLVGVIEISQLNYIKNGKANIFAISGGILDVKLDEVLILADAFESQDEIDVNRANLAKQRAQEKLDSKNKDIDLQRAELALKRALNRLLVAEKK